MNMKLIYSGLLLLIAICLCPVAPAIQASDEGKMSAEDRAKVIKLLKDSGRETLAAVESLSDEQLRYKEDGKWSVADVAEHIMLAEGLLFGAMQQALAAKENPEWEMKTKGKTEFLEKALVNRSTKVKAPESIVPSGKLSRAELIAKLKESRGNTLKFAEETQVSLKSHTFDHPFPVFGTLNAYQWLIYIPLHNMRHNQQIAEVQASANFPKK